MAEAKPEVWLRGPVAGIPDGLQPAAHALLQAAEEIEGAMKYFPSHLLWQRPAGAASPGFHLLHIKGVLQRLCTYARGHALTPEQFTYLQAENFELSTDTAALVTAVNDEINNTINYMKTLSATDLTTHRGVGRQALPSTVQGLLFHAAEHTMRHLGQLLVTARILQAAKHSN